ncbi:MAG: hypothetical protein M1831_001336 [Alyxoria varia]|nr:MAG: hypothetical protein M1831_001336 [Alyxoria varia]
MSRLTGKKTSETPEDASVVTASIPGGDTILDNIFQAFLDPEGTVCFNQLIWVTFLSLLLFLQGITIMWFTMILRVAWSVVKGHGADDSRSDDEEDVEAEDEEVTASEVKVSAPITVPQEQLVGVEALNFKPKGSPRYRSRKAGSHASGISIATHPDKKELLGRIGCRPSATSMPGGRKGKKHSNFSKPPKSDYVHPSLASKRDHSHRGNSSTTPSVNDRIDHLRRTQRHHKAGNEDPNSAKLEPRSRLLGCPSGRVPAGPPPPRSWVISNHTSEMRVRDKSLSFVDGGNKDRWPTSLGCCIPMLDLPREGSLLHMTMIAMATEFEWHVEYDHAYLSILPVWLKANLLCYIAKFGPEAGVSLRGLKMLFHEGNPAGASTEQVLGSPSEPVKYVEIKRMDLSGSIGRGLPLKELKKYWVRRRGSHRQTLSHKPADVHVPESWDEDSSALDLNLHALSLADSPLRFPYLTHLSLAHPSPSVSWMDLIDFSEHLGALTHLSLAYWPPPRLSASCDLPQYDMQDRTRSSWETAHDVLSLLSRRTPSLTWLSLEGCHPWLRTLLGRSTPPFNRSVESHRNVAAREMARRMRRDLHGPGVHGLSEDDLSTAFPLTTSDGPGWAKSWRHVSCIHVPQGFLPKDGLHPRTTDALEAARRVAAVGTRKGDPVDDGTFFGIQTALSQVFQSRDEYADVTNQELFVIRNAIAWVGEPRRATMDREIEEYRVIPPEGNTTVREQLEKRIWLTYEAEALFLAKYVRRVRESAGLKGSSCEFDFGWEEPDLARFGNV